MIRRTKDSCSTGFQPVGCCNQQHAAKPHSTIAQANAHRVLSLARLFYRATLDAAAYGSTWAVSPCYKIARTILLLALILSVGSAFAQTQFKLIPTPQRFDLREGGFRFTEDTAIVLDRPADPDDRFAAEQLIEEVKNRLNIQLSIAGESKGP